MSSDINEHPQQKTASPVTHRLSWERHPLRQLLRLSWPIAGSMISYALLSTVDTYFVSRISTDAVAGVGLGATACWTVIYFCIGVLMGVKVLVSQAVGAGERDSIAGYLSAAMLTAVCLGFVILLLGFVLAAGLPLMASSEEVGAVAARYAQVRLLGAPIMLLMVAMREVRYGLSDSLWPMVAMILTNFANGVLNYLFIIELDWGAEGAAWGTVAANVFALPVLFYAQLKDGGIRLRALTKSHLRLLWSVGIPTGFQFFLEIGSFMLLAGLLARFGDAHLGAHYILLPVIHFAFLPIAAVAESVGVMVGEAVGANHTVWVMKLARLGFYTMAAYALPCALVMIFAGEPLVAVFTDDPLVVALAAQAMIIVGLFQLSDAANMVLRNTLRGAGDVVVPAVITTTVAWLTTPAFTWVFGDWMGLGVTGGWLALWLEISISVAILGPRLLRGGWRKAAERTRHDRQTVRSQQGNDGPQGTVDRQPSDAA